MIFFKSLSTKKKSKKLDFYENNEKFYKFFNEKYDLCDSYDTPDIRHCKQVRRKDILWRRGRMKINKDNEIW